MQLLRTTRRVYLSVCLSPLAILPFIANIFRQPTPENLWPYSIFFAECIFLLNFVNATSHSTFGTLSTKYIFFSLIKKIFLQTVVKIIFFLEFWDPLWQFVLVKSKKRSNFALIWCICTIEIYNMYRMLKNFFKLNSLQKKTNKTFCKYNTRFSTNYITYSTIQQN